MVHISLELEDPADPVPAQMDVDLDHSTLVGLAEDDDFRDEKIPLEIHNNWSAVGKGLGRLQIAVDHIEEVVGSKGTVIFKGN